MPKLFKKQIIEKHNFIKKHEGSVTSYVDVKHEELTKIRTRMQEIYQITLPLRKETYNLRLRHEQLVSMLTGVKIGK